jgi:hypothetical protein
VLAGKRVLWIAVAVLAVFGGIQFVPTTRTNPPVQSDVTAPAAVKAILRDACYDCHSNETRWPWYSRVAPVSWLVTDHVNEGREDLNFSEWPVFDFEEQALAFKDIREQVSGKKMPLRSYRILHSEARLSDAQRDTILQWAGVTDR